jgi:hypothetical protein
VHYLKSIYLLLLFIIIIIFLVVCFGNDRVLVLIIEDKTFALVVVVIIVDVFAFDSVVVGLTVVFRGIMVGFIFISFVFKK